MSIDLKNVKKAILSFDGLKRKKPIAKISECFEKVRDTYGGCAADLGDDAAAIMIPGDDYILFAADGIWGRLLEKSPWWAGYTAVLSNVNDIYAMGGKPLAMVDIVSSGSPEELAEIFEGMAAGVQKFGVPVVGGHTHPDPGQASVSIAIIGTVGKENIIRSDRAGPGDDIIMAVDLDGHQGPNSPYSWESTSHKSRGDLMKLYGGIQTLAVKKLLTAGKDISNPGIIGTLGMLCESSGTGAIVDLEKIVRPTVESHPDQPEIPIERWVLVHPGSGFILTAGPENSDECLKILEEAGFTAAVVGKITEDRKIVICAGDSGVCEEIIDLSEDSITGIGKTG